MSASRPVKPWEFTHEQEGSPELTALLEDGWEPFAAVYVPTFYRKAEEDPGYVRIYLRRVAKPRALRG
jgi:hypothetical protein